jgi:hypothetical protein
MFPLLTWVRYLVDPWVEYGALTFFATVFSLVVKVSLRRQANMEREDWAIGLDLAQTAIFAMLANTTVEAIHTFAAGGPLPNQAAVAKLLVFPYLLLFLFLVLLSCSIAVRRYGWEPSRSGQPAKLNWFGTLGPIPVGLVYMLILIKWVRS